MTAFQYCWQVYWLLECSEPENWCECFVTHRMGFQKYHLKGVVCSTLLGADFFTFTLRALAGMEHERLYRSKALGGEFNDEYNLDYRRFIERERANVTDEEKRLVRDAFTPITPGLYGGGFGCNIKSE